MSKPRRYEDVLDEDLRDPAEAVGYLNACLEDGDPEVFLLALRDVARARGGVATLAEAILFHSLCNTHLEPFDLAIVDDHVKT